MKIKICGIKSEAEARAVLACEYRGRRVDFLGVIFAKSVRRISQETARKIAQIAHENGAKIVGVFGEQKEKEICEIAKFCALDVVQIYRQTDATFMQNLATIRAGNLQTNLISNLDKNFTQNFSQENHAKFSNKSSKKTCARFLGLNLSDGLINQDEISRPDLSNFDENFAPNLRQISRQSCAKNLDQISSEDFKSNLISNRPQIWQVIRIKDEIPKISGVFDMILFDYKGANLGGNGRSFDFGLLKKLDFKFGIAGGIGAHNIDEAMKFCPEILDINSKVEDEFGIKNPNLINEILKKVEQ